MEALLLLISNYKQDKVSGTCTDAARANRGWEMTLYHDQMMYVDGFLLSHLIAYFCDVLYYLFCASISIWMDRLVSSPAQRSLSTYTQACFFVHILYVSCQYWFSKSLLKVL